MNFDLWYPSDICRAVMLQSSFTWSGSVQFYYYSCLLSVLRSNYQEEMIFIPSSGLALSHFRSCLKAGTFIFIGFCHCLIVFWSLMYARWVASVVICYIDLPVYCQLGHYCFYFFIWKFENINNLFVSLLCLLNWHIASTVIL